MREKDSYFLFDLTLASLIPCVALVLFAWAPARKRPFSGMAQ